MVKSYLKYEAARSFGTIASSTANLIWTPAESTTAASTSSAGFAVVPANEEVLTWDIKKGECVARWRDVGCRSQITSLARSHGDPDVFAVGYEDGSVRLWDRKIGAPLVRFDGHKAAVTKLAFDAGGVRLASGSKDTDVIIWDLIAEVGEYKLRGHKDQITGLRFVEPDPAVLARDGADEAAMEVDEEMSREGFLLTVGKDSLIKLWDLMSRHCVETHVVQTNGESWALGVKSDLSACITAGNDGEMKVWKLDVAALAASARRVDLGQSVKFLEDRGTLHRDSKDRAVEVVFHPKRDYFAVHGVERAVEVWRVRSESEVKKALARKRKRRREKAAKASKTKDMDMAEDELKPEDMATADVSEWFGRYANITRTGSPGKVRSVDWTTGHGKDLQLLVGATSNQLELWSVTSKEKSARVKKDEPPAYDKLLTVELPGHRTDVRALAISSDDKMLASAANGSLKIWNLKTQTCIRTFECGYALCCAFLPGDKVVVVGTREGEVQIYDVASSTLLDTVNTHEKSAIWSLQVHPDGRSLVTGSADKTAKFWDFKIVQEPVLGTTRSKPRLKLVQSRMLKVTDDILSLKISPDAKFLAVALLDSTVKVFFTDTLKLFLNLYGHKLPVLSMDISFDSKLIVTGSADKNVRIWGLDFGDCHKALFGHQDSILQVVFVPHNSDGNGHHFFSSSKDRVIKYWDGDKFEQIQRLDGHHGEVWALGVGHGGNMLVSAGHDKSIRVWRETDEQIFMEEERERELEELYEGTLTASLGQDEDGVNREKSESDGLAGPASKQTAETLTAGERIAEALELGMADMTALAEWEKSKKTNPKAAPPARHAVFVAKNNMSAEQHVFNQLRRVPPAALHDALLVLPFIQVPALLTILGRLAARGIDVPLTCRVLFFVLRAHHAQIVASRTMRMLLEDVRGQLRSTLRRVKDEMGFNVAALRLVGMRVKDRSIRTFVDERWEEFESETENGKRKRAFVLVS